jgi:hypothetical protein
VQRLKKTLSGNLTFDKESGWVSWNSSTQTQGRTARLFWLPADLRGDAIASYEGIFAVASRWTDQPTIIDFTPMLNALCDMGLII